MAGENLIVRNSMARWRAAPARRRRLFDGGRGINVYVRMNARSLTIIGEA